MLTGGVVALATGAHLLVRGSSSLALKLGMSPLAVGLTVVAFGTSSPELITSVGSALRGNPDMAMGNVIGSNICNVALILGVTALIQPLSVQNRVIRREIPIMLVASAVMSVLAFDGSIGRLEGGLLLSGFIIYIWTSFRQTDSGSAPELMAVATIPELRTGSGRLISLVVCGLALLVGGAHYLVEGAVALARFLRVSEAVIGLTIVAAGTSLPELATSTVAAFKGKVDLALGNVIGSNVFNISAILGMTGLVQPLFTEDVSIVDLGVMLVFTALVFPLAHSRFTLSRPEGLLLVVGYGAYITYLMY